ncbi:hypothetical protein ATANTOWER_026574 [Ataeniobius toweri]|uniref:Uncharacterized protein n=1 Tax=Ataeniobius toweri TaxID=208326 RepID=A0ABU7AI18_9TELE|nr:hypothetical protein [Ataeniobius toweri]
MWTERGHPLRSMPQGQEVWLSSQNFPLKAYSKKLAPWFLGPFKIESVISHSTVHLKLPHYRVQCCVLSVQGVTGRCCCTGVAHLRAISWATFGVETQREASARFLTWSSFTEGSHGTFLVSVFTHVMFRGVWELQPRHLSPEPPLCFQAQLLRSHLRTTNQPACPPSNVKTPQP